MKIEEKIEFWTKSLLEDHSEENVRRFLADREHCPYGTMACTFCSHGCFKINVLWNISFVDEKLANDLSYMEMNLATEQYHLTDGRQTEQD